MSEDTKVFKVCLGISILCHFAAILVIMMLVPRKNEVIYLPDEKTITLTFISPPEALVPLAQVKPAPLPIAKPPAPAPAVPKLSGMAEARQVIIPAAAVFNSVVSSQVSMSLLAISNYSTNLSSARINARAMPNYLDNPEPAYPATARRRHQEGLVLVSVTVSPRGRPTRVVVKTSSGFPLLDAAALAAVQNWKFTPARMGNLAIESEVEVPVRFKLAD